MTPVMLPPSSWASGAEENRDKQQSAVQTGTVAQSRRMTLLLLSAARLGVNVDGNFGALGLISDDRRFRCAEVTPILSTVKRREHAWLSQVLIDELLEVAQRPEGAVLIEGQLLHHLHGADVLHRINPELGIENARPTQAAGAAECCRWLLH